MSKLFFDTGFLLSLVVLQGATIVLLFVLCVIKEQSRATLMEELHNLKVELDKEMDV